MSTKKNVGAKGRQNWATPWAFFNWLNKTFGPFVVDVCAETWSAKCPLHYTKEIDGLAQNWARDCRSVHPDGKFFCNPEFDGPDAWLEKGYRHARYDATSGLYVLPSSTDTGWFHDLAALGDVVLLRGRVNFDPPPGYKPPEGKKQTGNNAATILVIYEPDGIKMPEATKAGMLSLTAARWAPRGPPQDIFQGKQLPLIGA